MLCTILQGIYQAALGVYKHLMANEVFISLASKPVRATMAPPCKLQGGISRINFLPLCAMQEYRIVLTGRSLGAGVASVLAVLFKDNHRDWSENLEAFNFATPPVFRYDCTYHCITIKFCCGLVFYVKLNCLEFTLQLHPG